MSLLSRFLFLLFLVAVIAQADLKPTGFGNRPTPWERHDVPAEFSDPFGLPRPTFRYWVPDADVEDNVLYTDLREIKAAGWDGVEVICLENYGIERAVVDPAIFGYGGSLWRQRFNTMLRAAQDLNLTVDFALGPTQGASIPILDPNSPGMNTELVYGQVNLTAGQAFSSPLPQPMRVNPGYANAPDFYPPQESYTNTFVAAVLIRRSDSTSHDPRVVQLDYSSVQELNSRVANNTLTFKTPNDGDYVLLAFWQRRTGYLAAQGAFNNATGPSNPASWFAYVVDHFSQAGTDLWTNFTEQYVMNGENADLLQQLGLYAWEDSAEFRAELFWTDGFISYFIQSRGYSPIAALACQFGTTGLPPSTLANGFFYFSFVDDSGADISWKLRNDYRQALQEAYEQYHLEGLSKWAATWNLQGSLQPYATAPNLAPPWDMNSAAAHIDAPETESNYFDDVLDAFRAMGGGAMMGQKQIFSSELGAHRYYTYAVTWPIILNDCRINYAGDVNRIVTHGFPYSGLRPAVEWPGLTTFEWTYSEMWGPRQPSWDYVREFGDWIGRTQLILQSGRPRVDIGIYRHQYISVDIKHFGMGEVIFGDSSLANAGYSYVSVSPSLPTRDNAVVEDDLLAPDGPGFSAFIVDNSTNITSEVLSQFLDYANKGFPIIFVGGVPHESPYFCTACDEYILDNIEKLLAYPSVGNVSTEAEVVSVLQRMNVIPAAENLDPCPILYVHRIDEANGVEYFWAYNSDLHGDHATKAAFKATGTPFQLNAWNGAITPAVNYTVNAGRYELWIDLRSNASTIIAFAPKDFFPNVTVPQSHIVSTNYEDGEYDAATKSILLKSSWDGPDGATLSDGRTLRSNSTTTLPPVSILTSWQLVVQDWLPNPDPYHNYTSVFKYHNYTLSELVPWCNIKGLEFSSGIGTYTASFQWSSNSTSTGAYLDLGKILHTARLWVNEHWTGPIEIENPVVDIRPYLVYGVNTVKIEVSTTLRNRLLQFNNTQSWEQAKYAATYAPQPYGLVQPVVLRPYSLLKIPL
ncbi:hypothetical protein EV356DRAFT_446019 [Viridothelium virens]|uniref:Glycoside hydrolase family 2 protein n=1 Tax=Viridothelium virens TaxID=1048519 RepID=A0A6A6HA95_VIRVR|nr:hypothetical protein EV356DRAFT_446019 [Viridothelium virens]